MVRAGSTHNSMANSSGHPSVGALFDVERAVGRHSDARRKVFLCAHSPSSLGSWRSHERLVAFGCVERRLLAPRDLRNGVLEGAFASEPSDARPEPTRLAWDLLP